MITNDNSRFDNNHLNPNSQYRTISKRVLQFDTVKLFL